MMMIAKIIKNKLRLLLLAGVLSLFSSAYAQDNLVLQWGDGTSFTNVDALTPTPNQANWAVTAGSAQIQVVATFANVGTVGSRTITVTIPRGFKIQAYTAKSGTPAISGVSQLQLSSTDDAKLNSSTLTALDGTSFAAQQILGYTGATTSVSTPYHNSDGMIAYDFTEGCDNITLTFTLALDPMLFPYNATSTILPNISVSMQNSAGSGNILNKYLTITATGLVTPLVASPNTSYAGNGYTRSVEGVVDSSNPATGTVPAFMTGVAYSDYNNYGYGSMVHFADTVVFTTSYPAGVQYQGFDLLPQTTSEGSWWQEPYHGDSNGGNYANGHLTVSVDAVNRKVTYTFSKVRAGHLSSTLIRSYWTATVDGSAIQWNKGIGFTTTMTEISGSLIGTAQNYSSANSSTITITPVPPSLKIVLTPKNMTLRDLNAYAPVGFDQILGSFSLNNIGPSTPQNLTYTFTFPESPEVHGVSLPAAAASDATITATGITNTGDTVSYSGALSTTKTTHSSIQLTPQLLNLPTGEYLRSLTVVQSSLTVANFQANYTDSPTGYYGKWNNGQEGDVQLTITSDNDSILDSKIDHTTIGWTNSGAGTITTTVATPTGNAANTFYPGQQINFTSSYTAGGFLSSTNPDNLDPDIYINLPEGIDLDVSSVSAQSPSGNHGSSRFALQLVDTTIALVKGVSWTSYHFQVQAPLDIVAISANLINYVNARNFNLTYTANVSTACSAYPTLQPMDLCQFDLGQTAVSITSTQDYTVADTCNWTGKGTNYKLVGAKLSANLSVVQKPGLQVYLGIKTAGAEGNYYTYNGTSATIAPTSTDQLAEVWLKYENTSNASYYVGSEIYLPIPKKNIAYDHFFNNINLNNPASVEGGSTANLAPQWSSVLVSEVDLPEFITYYGVSTSSTTNYTSGDIALNWTPIDMTWYSYSDLTAAGKTLADVTMLKFVANVPITAVSTPGSTGETTFNLSVASDAEIGQYDYWRSYEKGWIDTQGTGTWVYGSAIAATPAMSGVRGMFFNDNNGNGILDSGAGEAYVSMPAGFGATLSGTGIVGSLAMVINSDGSFQSLNSDGSLHYLTAGTYTVTLTNTHPELYHFSPVYPANRSYFSNGNPVWMNDIQSTLIRMDNTIATFVFMVTSTSTVTQLVGVAIKNSPKFIPVNPNVRGWVN